MSCTDKRQIINLMQGVPGEQGPEGPPGVPGAEIQLPIAASDVSVTNTGFSTVQDVINYLLYTPIVINSFNTPVDIFEIGIVITSLTFNWTLNFDPITQTLTGPNITPPTLASTDRTVILSVSDLQGSIPGDTFPYVLTVSDGSISPQATENINFYNGVYVGDATIPGSIDSTFINTLNKTLQVNKDRTWTANAAGTQYVWACWRKTLGLAVFQVGQFIGGFEAPVTVSHTNPSGYVEDYYVARSTNPDIGPVTISMS